MTRPELLRPSLAWLPYPGSWSSASADDDRALDDDDVGRAFLPADLGTSVLTGRRDGDWLTGTGAAITGLGSDRRRADTVVLACTFRIPVEGFAVAGLATDLVGEATVFFDAGRVGAIVFF
jgi:hypothetical protein